VRQAIVDNYNRIHPKAFPTDDSLDSQKLRLLEERYLFDLRRIINIDPKPPSQPSAVTTRSRPLTAWPGAAATDAQRDYRTDLESKGTFYDTAVKNLEDLASAKENERWLALTAASKDAKARIVWIGAVVVQFLASIGTIIGGLWVVYVSLEEQTSIAPAFFSVQKRNRIRGQRDSRCCWLLVFLVAAGICEVVLYCLMNEIGNRLFNGKVATLDDWPLVPPVSDNMFNIVKQYLMPGVEKLQGLADTFLGIANAVVVLSVALTLCQRDDDLDCRTDPTKDPDKLYQHFLT